LEGNLLKFSHNLQASKSPNTFFIENKYQKHDAGVKERLRKGESDMKEGHSCQLCIKSFTLAIGIVWCLTTLILGWTSIFGWGNAFVETMASIYIGYEASFVGGIIGGIWGFVGGAIGGLLVSFFYNLISLGGNLKMTKKTRKK